jgi:pimeloyl-ACP methyl ester carboxylesterase
VSGATSAPISPRPLPPALAGEPVTLQGSFGRVHAYAAGPAPGAPAAVPLLLLHSVNAAASAAEVRPLFDALAPTRAVLAPDLPGYGLSERSDRVYTPRLMTDAVKAAIEALRQRTGAAAVDVLGVSLGCEFVARAAAEAPQAVRRVVLVSPTGLRGTKRREGAEAQGIGPAWVQTLLRGPGRAPGRGSGWGEPLFRGLTRPDVIRYFLRRTWGSKDIDEALWRYDILATRQPGAEHAPLSFLAAALFSADVTRVYESMPQPVWAVHGTRGDFTDYRGLAVLRTPQPWQVTVMKDTGALMYFERPEEFVRELLAFLDR